MTINESISQLHDQGFEVENISEEVLQLMAEIKRWVSKTKQPYPSLEEDPFFYYLLLQNLETLQNAEREYQNICEVFLASKKIQNKSGGKPKRFRTNREMKREEEFEHALMQLESLSEEISELQDELTLVVINNLTPTKDNFSKQMNLEHTLEEKKLHQKILEDRFSDELNGNKINNFISLNSTLFREGGIERTLRIICYGEEILGEVIDELKQIDFNGGLISILGDPGWGKTIQLRQFTHGFLNDQIQERNIHQIPIYVKAKTLSKHIRNLASSHYGFAVNLPDGGVVDHGGKTTRMSEKPIKFSSDLCLRQNQI